MDRELLVSQGWGQGSILPRKVIELIPCETDSDDLWIVLSHHCDVLSEDFEREPHVELLRAKRITSEPNGNLLYGKNPRKVQFLNGPSYYEASVHDRVCIQRHLLGIAKADGSLEQEVVRLLGRWVAKRYTRAAFPDAFNERVRSGLSGVVRLAKKKGSNVSGVYVALSSSIASGPTLSFSLLLYVTMRVPDFEDGEKRLVAQEFADGLGAILDECDGICVEECTLISEADLSLDDLRLLRRWDWDYLSERTLPSGAMAPDV